MNDPFEDAMTEAGSPPPEFQRGPRYHCGDCLDRGVVTILARPEHVARYVRVYGERSRNWDVATTEVVACRCAAAGKSEGRLVYNPVAHQIVRWSRDSELATQEEWEQLKNCMRDVGNEMEPTRTA